MSADPATDDKTRPSSAGAAPASPEPPSAPDTVAPPVAGSPFPAAPAPPIAARTTRLEFVTGRPLSGRYIMRQKLGEGGMGTVYLADDLLLRRQVAVKTLFEEDMFEEQDIDRFRKEVALTHAISHPNVARTYDLGAEKGVHFITMEYLKGGTLMERIRKGVLSAQEVRDIARPLCMALRSAHRVGVIHRDLKPANIMMVPDARKCVVMDFGIARSMAEARGEDLTRTRVGPDGHRLASTPWDVTSAGLGTPAYMAPEQWEGLSGDHRTDIYALGVILYVCLTGQAPFIADTATGMGEAHKSAPVPDVSKIAKNVDLDLRDLIMTCLAKKPAARPQSMDDVLYRLDVSKRRKQFAVRTTAVALASAVVLGLLGLGLFELVERALLQEMRPAQKRLAQIVARDVEVADLDQLRSAQDANTEVYKKVRAVLEREKAADPNIRSVYIMRPGKTEGWWENVVESEPDPGDMDTNKNGVVEPNELNVPGTPYDGRRFPEMAVALKEGKAIAELDFTFDEIDFTLAGFAPIPPRTPNAPYLAGADVRNQQLTTLLGRLTVSLCVAWIAAVGAAAWFLRPSRLRRLELEAVDRQSAASAV